MRPSSAIDWQSSVPKREDQFNERDHCGRGGCGIPFRLSLRSAGGHCSRPETASTRALLCRHISLRLFLSTGEIENSARFDSPNERIVATDPIAFRVRKRHYCPSAK